MRMPMMLRRMRPRLLLSSHHHRETIHDRYHHPLISRSPLLKRVPSPPLLIRHRPREDRSPLVSRIWNVLRCSGRWSVALGAFKEAHDVGLDSVRLADRLKRWDFRLRLMFVGLRVRVMALDRDGVPHRWWDDVRETLDSVRCVDFVARHAGYFVHPEVFDSSFALRHAHFTAILLFALYTHIFADTTVGGAEFLSVARNGVIRFVLI